MATIHEDHVRSLDGVEIVYSAAGDGPTSLLFIHGGLANRSFWAEQLTALSDHYRVVALDLAGHGDSGRTREKWTIDAFAEDVKAVALSLDLGRVVLIGNSLGGPVALHSAKLLRGRVIGVIGVDALHDATQKVTPDEARERADMYRKDFKKTCLEMAAMLFHPDRAVKLRKWAEAHMLAMPPGVVAGIMEDFAGFDMAKAFREAGVPLRAINGDLFPTKLELNRSITPDFDAVIMKDACHYPMLERPDEFNTHLLKIVEQFEKAT